MSPIDFEHDLMLLAGPLQAHVKQEMSLGPETCYRGYQQLGSNVTRFDGGFQRDHHEAIDLYKEESDRVRAPRLPKHEFTQSPPRKVQKAEACREGGHSIVGVVIRQCDRIRMGGHESLGYPAASHGMCLAV